MKLIASIITSLHEKNIIAFAFELRLKEHMLERL
jgi:hypothetical protein